MQGEAPLALGPWPGLPAAGEWAHQRCVNGDGGSLPEWQSICQHLYICVSLRFRQLSTMVPFWLVWVTELKKMAVFFSHLFQPNPLGPCAEPENKAHGRLATRGWKSPQLATGWPCMQARAKHEALHPRGGWDGAVDVGCAMQGELTGTRQQTHGRLRRLECRDHLCTSTGTTLVQTAPGYEPGAGRIRQPRNSSGLQHRWRVRLVGIAGRVGTQGRCAPWPSERCARRRRRCGAGAVADSGI